MAPSFKAWCPSMPINDDALYVYRARVLRVIDGDTVEVEIDLGFSVSMTRKVRLYGIDAPEVRGAEKLRGEEARDHLIKLSYLYALNQQEGRVMNSPALLIKTYKDRSGKYGRILGTLMGLDKDDNPIDLNQKMVEDSFASPRET